MTENANDRRSSSYIDNKDRETAAFLQQLITNEAQARELVKKHNHLGREIIRQMHLDKEDFSDKANKKLGENFNERKDEGLRSPTVDGFNEYINDLVLLSEQLKTPKSFLELSDFYLEAATETPWATSGE